MSRKDEIKSAYKSLGGAHSFYIGKRVFIMKKYTVKIDGMMCGMCEAHINDAIRAAFPDAKKVKASHSKGIASFISEGIDDNNLRKVIDATGYTLVSVESEEFVKKGLFW